jgi:acetoin utilization protein AcuB
MEKNVLARDIMSSNVITVYDDATINFTEVLAEAKYVRHIPVLNRNEEVIGVISTRSILAHLTGAANNRFIAVKELISDEPIIGSPQQSIAEIAELMRSHNVSAVPIVEKGKVVGMVSERDFLKLH